ncbi:Cysteine-rich secretory protein family protein [Cognatiyoonia koreensis]|uniref:Cysteine-rich secretory protein family protein n=1 Tax=Cognatiyoonia koreensis TaxID=364200 RepID=A0A1I0RNK4_9RHOB|nr:CAP domain-containing protein [Cognatiyoonia koreensis]SEW42836.1 Cysteine-rich secretory protein family protein [Cognatiyoonia koreensis]
MLRREILLGGTALALTACARSNARVGPDGLPLPQVYNIGPGDKDDIQFRMLDSVNTLRQAAGVPAVELDASLNAAAETHSRDMSVQNRPWLFGSDGSSPIDRAQRAGFQGRLLGENISESYETELETLAAWMKDPDTRSVILDANARRMGLGWFQEPAGKLWWTMNMGGDPAASRPIPSVLPGITPVSGR